MFVRGTPFGWDSEPEVNSIMAVFHYVPLHSSNAGLKFSRFNGIDEFTATGSEQLIRLPLWFGISTKQQEGVIHMLYNFYLKLSSQHW